MDDTLEDAGIPVLQNGDIPVHSTPIKGEKVPLPSTRHVSKFLQQQRSHRRLNETETESVQSVHAAEITGNKADSIDRQKDGYKPTYIDSQKSHHKQQYPQADKILDISSQDNLRPKAQEIQRYSDYLGYDNMKMKTQKKDKDRGGSSSARKSFTGNQCSSDSFSSEKQGSSVKYSETILPGSDANRNAFSSYKMRLKKDGGNSSMEGDKVSCSVQISSPRTSGNLDAEKMELTPDKQTFQFHTYAKSGLVNRDNTLTDEKKFNSSKLRSRLDKENSSFSVLENSTITKQRQEIQLLVSELKDRDRELSDMMSSHQQQLLAWEHDRLRLTALEKKSCQLEEDLKTKLSQLRNAVQTLKVVKTRESESKAELEKFKNYIETAHKEKTKAIEEIEEYKLECTDLQKQLMEMSSRVLHLQARETELTTNIKTKEKDISFATNQMKELSTRLQQLDIRCKECQDREKEALREKDVWKEKYDGLHGEVRKLSEELNTKRVDYARMLDENRLTKNRLSFVQKEADEREKCKDEVIESMREKQERTDKQLKNIRELYERQLKEVAQLQMQLDTSSDVIQKQQTSMDQLHFTQSDRSSDQTHDRSGARQHLTFSPQRRISHSQKKREPDSSHFTQSSGYQSQLSENQTGINAGNQITSTSSIIDYKHSQSKHLYMINKDTSEEDQKNLNFPDSNFVHKVCEDEQTSRTAHEENLWHKSVESNKRESQSASFDENLHGPMRPRGHIKVKDMTPPPSPNRKHESLSESPSAKQTVVIKHTTISMCPDNPSDDHKPGLNEISTPNRKTEVSLNKTTDVKQKVETDSVDKDDSKVGTSFDFEQEFIFENKMRSFLEDFEMDCDDSIWEEKPERTQSISGVDCSPSSKLQKLLLESRMMIESLEKSADLQIQTFKTSNANDTLEKPNFDESHNDQPSGQSSRK